MENVITSKSWGKLGMQQCPSSLLGDFSSRYVTQRYPWYLSKIRTFIVLSICSKKVQTNLNFINKCFSNQGVYLDMSRTSRFWSRDYFAHLYVYYYNEVSHTLPVIINKTFVSIRNSTSDNCWRILYCRHIISTYS